MGDTGRRFAEVFHGEPGRGAYLSRLFAFFSEEVVRQWAACPEAPYSEAGRPVVWDADGQRFHALDFTLVDRETGGRYVAELKCEIEFQNYAYLELVSPEVVRHHETGAAFQKLLQLAEDPGCLRVTIGGEEQRIDGAILVWGAMTVDGRRATIHHYRFADVLSIEEMLEELADWRPEAWAQWVDRRRRWTDDLFEFLRYPPAPE